MSRRRFAQAVKETREWEQKEAAATTRRESRKNWKIPANVVLTFISENPEYLPSLENYGGFTIEENILRVRLMLWRTRIRFDRFVGFTKAQNVTNISETMLVSLLKASRQKKYRERGSPAFSAAALCGSMLKGNDGAMYQSVKNSAGVCSWIKS